MIRSTLQAVVVIAVLCFFSSCTVDRCQIISHPSSCQQGDTVPVVFSDIYLIISPASTANQNYTRDSLHIGYGLPAGWSVLSSDFYVATGIQMSQMASLLTNPSLITNLIQDSLAVYMSRKSVMTKDNGWGAYFKGRTFTAHNTAANDSIVVDTSYAGQWAGYSGKISLSVVKGTKMDTGVALATLPIDSSTQSLIRTLYGTDSIWVKAVPIVCFAQLIASQTVGIDTLLYFTKTGPKPTGGSSLVPNYDKGDMTYVPFSVVPRNAVIWPLTGRAGQALLNISPSTLTMGARITLSIGASTPWRLSVCDAAGKTVRSFSTDNASLSNNRIVWDGTSATGSALTAGTYCIRLETSGKTVSQTLRVVK